MNDNSHSSDTNTSPVQSKLLDTLMQFPNWVCHGPDKVPLRIQDGFAASPTNPVDWVDWQTAAAFAQANPGYGLGFVLTAECGLTCVDLDASDDERIIANQTEIYNALNSYTERSPSGRGCHIWCKGSVPSGKKLDKVEIYSTQRYFTVTFNVLRDIPISDCQAQLTELYNAMNKGKGSNAAPEFESLPETDTDDGLLTKILQSAQGDLFKRLYEGDWKTDFPSQSEADLVLCNILAFWTDNKKQVERLFHRSGLGQRPKAKRFSYLHDKRYGIITKAFDQKVAPVDLTAIVNEVKQATENAPAVQKPAVEQVPLSAKGYSTDATVEIVSMASILSKPITWLWREYLPLGKLALLAGAAGTGKSTLAFSMAATVSSGGRWPDGTQCKAGHVLIWSSEDDASDTIRPRLMAMNANMDLVHVITAVSDSKGKMPFDPATHIPILKRAVLQQGSCSLLIVDPIVSAITGDMNKSNEVRRGLQSIVDFASELNCAVVGISHFAKGSTGSNPADRVIGSVAFGAFARVVLVAAKDEESHKRVFTRAKSNIGEDSGGFYYGIQPIPLADGITATRVVWGGSVDGSSRDILATVEHSEDSPVGAIQEAKKFLIEELKAAPRRAKELIEIAKQAGINEKTLQRARQQLGIETSKDGMGGGWVWSRPFTSLNGLNH